MPLARLYTLFRAHTHSNITFKQLRNFSSKQNIQKKAVSNKAKVLGVGVAVVGGAALLHNTTGPRLNAKTITDENDETSRAPHIVVVGGGIMGSWATFLLAKLISEDGVNCKVTLVDAGHPIRGSWGDTRALHVAMEDDVRIKMNMLNVNEYLKLQRESTSDHVLVRKAGRIFVGPEQSMQKMHSLIQGNGIPVDFVDAKFVENPDNGNISKTFNGIQLRSEDTGFPGWLTLYTPVGYIMKANSILNHLRERIKQLAETNKDFITVIEDHKVVSINRDNKKIEVRSSFDDDAGVNLLSYDKLLITAGPWTNQVLGPDTMAPPLPQLPVVISNEQTQDFEVLMSEYDHMPLVTYSDGGYVKSGGDYWFIVGPCPDKTSGDQAEKHVKVGFHRQGDLMDNQEFQLPKYHSDQDISDATLKTHIIDKLPHLRKDIKRGKDSQSFEVDDYILNKAKSMVEERLSSLDPDKISLVMRCLYQNTPDKEFIVGYHNDDQTVDKNNTVVACGFNGGGFQMGPMIARLCIKLLLSQEVSEEALVKLLEVKEEPSNNDYKTKGIVDISQLLQTMQTRFNPARESLKVKD